MYGLLKLQTAAVFLSAVSVWFFGGSLPAVGVLLGGLTYFIPTLLAVWSLTRLQSKKVFYPQLLFLVEAHKLLLIIVLMGVIYFSYPGLSKWGYLLGLVVAAQAGLLMFRKTFYYE